MTHKCEHHWIFSDELATPTKCSKCGNYLGKLKIIKKADVPLKHDKKIKIKVDINKKRI